MIPALAVVCLLAAAPTAEARPWRAAPPARYDSQPRAYVPPRPVYPPQVRYFPPVVPAYPIHTYSYNWYAGNPYPPGYAVYWNTWTGTNYYNPSIYFWYRFR